MHIMVKTATERKPYVPAVTPGLRRLLVVVFALAALLGANSVYLVAITLLEAASDGTYQNYFYQVMFLGHLVLGVAIILPFLLFGILHIKNAWRRKNRSAVRIGYSLFATSMALLATGLLLTRAGPLEIRDTATRNVFYWIHVVCPLVAVWLYWLHRLAGPPIRWRVGLSYLALVGAAALLAVMMHQSDPRAWYQAGSDEGAKYFQPSLARTANGKFIPQRALQNDAYCQECHADAHAGWAASAHRFSSFNNPAYLASVRETRSFSMDREGSVRRSRWCADCHDPVPFFSGEFDDPSFDDVNNPTAHAGITCTSCHAITNINSLRGNADYTIEEPLHYPFAYSDNELLQWINRQLVKAKPSFHKRTFLKPFHREPEFCGTCHKVHLPEELNDYKWLRGQNHFDSYHLSGGDPLTHSHGLRFASQQMARIPQVEILRVHTRFPLQFPDKVNFELLTGIAALRPTFYLSLHVDHPDELTQKVEAVIRRLCNLGAILLCQSVFLKGISDDLEVLARMFTRLAELGVRPYYIYHCHPIATTMRFVMRLETESR
ncbi:multiheme c-type cytochrome [Pirellulales bacterium]|nr:multiheme c-type cytochrome [Pirellulales bacterium]